MFDGNTIGGLGTGALKNVTKIENNNNVQINAYAHVTKIVNNTTVEVDGVVNSAYSRFVAGEEVVFHVFGCLTADSTDIGLYTFTHIKSVTGNTVTFTSAIPVIDLTKYACQLVTVPNFNNLTVNNAMLRPYYNADGKCGYIVIVKCNGTLDLRNNGKLITEGNGLPCPENVWPITGTGLLHPRAYSMSNNTLREHWVVSQGNGMVVIICKNLLLSHNSRLGATWSGTNGKGVADNQGGKGGDADGHFGGAGGSTRDGNWNGCITPLSEIQKPTPAGCSGLQNVSSNNNSRLYAAKGGACVFIAAENISGFCLDAISTGGEGGWNWCFGYKSRSTNGGAGYGGGGGCGDRGGCYSSAGGGAGVCYIATYTALPKNDFCYMLDNIFFSLQGLIVAKQPMNFTGANESANILFAGQEPAETKLRVLWRIGSGKWGKLVTQNGVTTFAEIQANTPTVNDVLNNGNTIPEIQTPKNIPPFIGKLVYPAIALYAPSGSVLPTLHIWGNYVNNTQQFTYTEYSQEYNLAENTYEGDAKNITIIDIVANEGNTGAGKSDISVALYKDGKWTDYMNPLSAHMQQASMIKFKIVYTVGTVNANDVAHVNNIKVTYTDGGSIVNGTSTDIVTKTMEFDNALSYIHAHIKHNKLTDSKIKVFAAIRETPKKRDMVQVANGTGVKETIKLPNDGINQDTINVYINGVKTLDFDYNVETSEITMTAEKGAAISASYQYGWKSAEWQEMTLSDSQHSESGYYTDTFDYTVPQNASYTVSAIKYTVERPQGHVNLATIGTATGDRQVYKLPHKAKTETVSCNCQFDYNEDEQSLIVIGDKGKDIVVSYDWIAESPHVYGIMAGWAD